MPPSILPIACAIDESYALPLAVMLESLKQDLRSGVYPVLYLVHRGLSESTLAAISAIVETHSLIPTGTQTATAPSDARFTVEAAFPLLIPDLLPPALDRVLFLDADMLVLGDLEELWETPMQRHVLAAAPDGAVPRCSAPRGVKGWRDRGIPCNAPYFNCGVLLVHLDRWRQREVARRARQYLETTRQPIDFLHQEALNAVLWNDWQPLDRRWNLLASLEGRSFGPPNSDVSRPGIVHYAGRLKPWRAPVGGPFDGPYRDVLVRVRSRFPAAPPTKKERLCSVYDRYLRGAFHPIERFLWRRRVI